MAIVLMVDDDPVLHRIMRFMLRRDNHTSVAAFTVEEALARLQEGPVDLVIVDLMMPGASGINLLEHLRGDQRYVHLPVVVLTASGYGRHRLEAEEKGASAFLQKPTSSAELTRTINHALGHAGVTSSV